MLVKEVVITYIHLIISILQPRSYGSNLSTLYYHIYRHFIAFPQNSGLLLKLSLFDIF